MAASEHVLLGDIGATNARFALLTDGVLGAVDSIAVADYPHFADAVEAFLGQHGGRTPAPVPCSQSPGRSKPGVAC